MSATDSLKFLCKWIAHPRTTGAVCPSSRFLAASMVRGAGNCSDGLVVELGAGTGAVTKFLAKAADKGDFSLCSVEFDPKLARILSRKFSDVKVVNDTAENIRSIIGEDLPKLRAIVSSLPLLSLPDSVVERIISEVEDCLPVGAKFVQYTYNLKREPSSLGFSKMRHVATSKIFLNIPPARVDVFEKLP